MVARPHTCRGLWFSIRRKRKIVMVYMIKWTDTNYIAYKRCASEKKICNHKECLWRQIRSSDKEFRFMSWTELGCELECKRAFQAKILCNDGISLWWIISKLFRMKHCLRSASRVKPSTFRSLCRCTHNEKHGKSLAVSGKKSSLCQKQLNFLLARMFTAIKKWTAY